MKLDEVKEQFRKIGIIPVVVLEDEKDALPLGKALLDGGLPCAEVTFRTDAAEGAIRAMSKEYPDLLVGAGTVLTIDQANRAIDAGAKFIVAPGLNPEIVDYCQKRGIPMAPGVQTPSEMEQALSFGLDFVKFFPAEPAGGLQMLKAVGAAYTALSFMPTGGVNQNNVRDYLGWNRILACGGSWMVKQDMVKAGRFDEITALVREAADIVKEIRG